MSKVIIVTDSTTYLPEDYIKQYAIRVIPLTLHWEDKTYRDGIDITPDEFYARLANSKSIPTTSQLSAYEVQQVFSDLLSQGFTVLGMFLSSGISGSYQSAMLAKSHLDTDKVEVIDTRLVSMALGFQVLAVARAAEQGASLKECVEVAQDAYSKIGVYFTVNTLKYLNQGGRIGSAKRIVGSALNIKPILEIRDGKIELVSSVISQKKAIERMIQLVEKGMDNRNPVRLSVFHAAAQEEAGNLTKRLQEQFSPLEIIPSLVSPVIGAHVGPGTLSIAYMAG